MLGSSSAPSLAPCRWLVDHGAGMTSEGRNRSNRWLQNPVWWIGSVALLGLVIAGVFGIRSLVVSSGEGPSSNGESPALAARIEEERAGVEGDESPVNNADGIALDDRPDEKISNPPVPPEAAAESSGPGSPEAEEAGEPPAPVTTIAEPSDPAPTAEDEDIEIEVGVGSPMSWATGAGWIVPWADGILEIGWLKIGEEPNGNDIYDETRLVARPLSDSSICQNVYPISEVVDLQECWGDLSHFQIANRGGNIRAIQSNGERLIVASKIGEQVYVSVTSDLIDWDTTEISLPHPPSLPDFVYAISHVDHLAIGPNGWLLKITSEFTIDILVQAGVKESRTGLSIYDLREELDGINGTSAYDDGVEIRWWIDEERSDLMEQFFTWEELGFDRDMFYRYYSPKGNKPYVFPENITGSVWTAAWGEEPLRTDLPDIYGTCCAIVGTDAGYVAISDPGAPGYDPTRGGSSKAFFSYNGQKWVPIDSPSQVFLDFWAVKDGIIVRSVPRQGDDELSGSNWDSIYWWHADSDGSNWREIEELPKPPMLAPFQYPTIRLATGIVAEPPWVQ